MATTEVADILMMVDCIEEADAYGVKVEGRCFLNLKAWELNGFNDT